MTRLEEIKYACHLAALAAIDEVLADELGLFHGKPVALKDKHLPALLPALNRAIEAAMREVYDLMPESLDVAPEVVARTKAQMEQSLANISDLRHLVR